MRLRDLGAVIMTLPDPVICDILGGVVEHSKKRQADEVLRLANENGLELSNYRPRQEELKAQSARQKEGIERARVRRENEEKAAREKEARVAELEKFWRDNKRPDEADGVKKPKDGLVGGKSNDQADGEAR